MKPDFTRFSRFMWLLVARAISSAGILFVTAFCAIFTQAFIVLVVEILNDANYLWLNEYLFSAACMIISYKAVRALWICWSYDPRKRVRW